MSISSEDRVTLPQICDGINDTFPFEFKVFEDEDILVVQTDDDGVETIVDPTDYTVNLNADQNVSPGGEVVMDTAPADDFLITITSQVANLQPVSLTNAGGFFPRVINDALDRLTILIQQLLGSVSRSIKFPISDGQDGVSTLPSKDLRKGKALVFDSVTGDVTVSDDDYDDQVAAVTALAAAAAASEAAAELAETNAETAETNAELAETNAETAAAAAEVARLAAVAAKTAAETAETNAETAETNAELAETNAETAETNAEAAQALAEAAAVAAAASAAQLQGTSTTSITIGTGTKVFTTQSGKFFNGQNVRVYSAANVANYMDGLATYSGTSCSVSVASTGGSGTLTDWVIKVNGDRGPTGATGAAGTFNMVTAAGTADAITATYSPVVTLTNLVTVGFVASAANATATPTFSPDGLTARTITKKGGVALVAGDIQPLQACIVEYNSANSRWELLNPSSSQVPWVVAAGTADALTATYAPAVNAVYDGLTLNFRAAAANATTTPTFAPNGLTARTIVKKGGGALVAGDIAGNLAEYVVTYNSANTRWELQNPSTEKLPWVVAGGTADALTATYVPAVGTVYDGLLLTFRAAAANATTTPTFAPNGLTARTITKNGGSALAAGDIAGNRAEYTVRYNSANTRWELMNPATAASASGSKNKIINGAFNVQRRPIATTDNAYVIDGHKMLLEAANAATFTRQTTGAPTGYKYFGRLTAGSGNNNKFGDWMPIEGKNIYDLRGQVVTASALLAATAGLSNIKMGIAEFTGTEDAISGDPISAWGADGVTPTLAAGWAFINTPANLSVGTSFAAKSVSATVGASTVNLAVIIWNDDKTTTQTTDKLDFTAIQLEKAASATAFEFRHQSDEEDLCEWYYKKISGGTATVFGIGVNYNNISDGLAAICFKRMRSAPTGTVSAAGDFEINQYGPGVQKTCVTFGVTQATDCSVSLAVGGWSSGTANAQFQLRSLNANAAIYLDAGL